MQLIGDFYSFAIAAWPVIEGGKQMQTGWMSRSICEHLEEVYRGNIRRLLINIPPRLGKSTLVSVLWPVWCWLNNPAEQFMTVSYSEKLSMRDNVRSRRLIRSQWFQQKFGDLVILSDDQDTKLRVDNMQGGYRVTTSIDGTVTGEGANIIILDDPNSVRDSSEVALSSAWDFYTQVLPSRFNDFRSGRMVTVQQRTDEKDISGHILANVLANEDDDTVCLILPMEFEVSRKCTTVPLKSTDGKKWEDPRKVEGELLCPERVGSIELKRLKIELGSEYLVSGQLQQRPSPAEGGIIKKKWFKIWPYKDPPQLDYVIESWDTAMTEGKTGAYSACTTWGVYKDEHGIPNVILLSANRKRMEFPELYDCVLRMSKDYLAFDIGGVHKINTARKPDAILIEDKASGITLSQRFSRLGISPIKFNPNKYGDKTNRVRSISHLIEAGRVWLPGVAPDYRRLKSYADEFVEECAKFPNAESRDYVDTLSMVLLRLSMTGWIFHPSDEVAQPKTKFADNSQRPALY